jgi:NADPH-dependent glutamate synthase beta subunit-like oxidoreductase/formate hydrogenlyase subunit 6/NADH:ubiquinone oxidoreductase subunit I
MLQAPSPDYNAIIEDLYRAERLPPCVGSCPANVDARGQNYLIADGKALEAYEIVRQRNVLPGVLGRICHHPCEAACARGYYDEPIAIRPLHRFAYEAYRPHAHERVQPLVAHRGKRVAIVGSGPSGLAAAFDLMQLGYGVSMFEKEGKPGGALYSGVPAYRLPREVLHGEIDDFVRMGLDLTCGVRVGKDIALTSLQRDYDAVLLAAGLQVSRMLPIPGADAPGVLGALDFLRDANWKGETGVAGKRVVVIGGGNVAVDAARCALRTGATEVRLASLESEDELPAHPWEIEEALDEGIIATCSLGPEEVLLEDGRITGIRMRECLSVFDEAGRFAPSMGETTTVLPGDVIVFAIGQGSDLTDVVAGSDVALNDRGNLVVDGSLFTTSAAGVFACGEVVTGPGSAIGSIATGHEAATSIHRFLSGMDLSADRVARPVPLYDKREAATLDGVEESRRRVPMPMANPAERVTDFRTIELGFTRQESLADATRCLRCQSEVCVGCTFCARTCPDYCIRVERVDDPGARCLTRYELDLSKCCFCGLCAEQCPTNALTHTGQYELSFYHRDLAMFDKGEMLRDPNPTRATGRDGIEPPTCPIPRRSDEL